MPSLSTHLVALTKHREAMNQTLKGVDEDIKALLADGLKARPEAEILLLKGSIAHDSNNSFRTYGLTVDEDSGEVLALDVRGLTTKEQLTGEYKKLFSRPLEELPLTERYSLVCILSFHNFCWTTFERAEADSSKYGGGMIKEQKAD